MIGENRMRYKTVGLLLAMSLAATVTACGNSGTEGGDNEQTTPPAGSGTEQTTPPAGSGTQPTTPPTEDGGEGGEG